MPEMIPTPLGRLRVQVQGEGPATAVLWHSLYVDDRSWDRVAPELARDRRLVRITGPGHGESDPPSRDYTLDDCADAALAVLDALGIASPVDWLGCAWGGHVGIVLAAAHPDRVRTLTSFNAPVQALGDDELPRVRLLVRAYRLIGARGPVLSGVTSALLSDETRSTDPDAVVYVHECLRGARRGSLLAAIRGISLGRADLRPLLARIPVPVLHVTTADDPLWTPEQARAAAALGPRADAVVASGGHLTPLEAPAETLAIVRHAWA
ncbi:alpha/beta fold hydrolase [Protaetiibacter sp. SSC-01]|uniref:alpha/beta fold hydrolase n=1 Tax=Protaetiibacter sp. SSC-01 TaxID=2759943 RepID=UPI001656B869|nr:alpha/beta hydrolase [Protaetiibacter sp. SSC-01]QNO37431.1 alpha/beta fold hydrolase [Protaetiibacter sp. SSC-01]